MLNIVYSSCRKLIIDQLITFSLLPFFFLIDSVCLLVTDVHHVRCNTHVLELIIHTDNQNDDYSLSKISIE